MGLRPSARIASSGHNVGLRMPSSPSAVKSQRMHDSLSSRWSRAVTKHWLPILVFWIALAVLGRMFGPSWNEVAYDGDFDYLPAKMPSVAGGKLLDRAFPGERSRSEIVLVLGRESGEFDDGDDIVGFDLLRRLHHRRAEVSWQRAIEYGYESGPVNPDAAYAPWLNNAREALDQSIEADEKFYELVADRLPDDLPTATEPRMVISYLDRARLLQAMYVAPETTLTGNAAKVSTTTGSSASDRSGKPVEPDDEPISEDDIAADLEAVSILMPSLVDSATSIGDRDLVAWRSVLDVLSWDDPLIGSRLQSGGTRLAVVKLSTELAATKNIATVESVQRLIDEVLAYSSHHAQPGLQLLMTGSAAVGGETLLAARNAIRYTEWFTVAMILLILASVYRAPLLVAVPVLSIGVAVVISTALVGALAKLSMTGMIPWLDLRVFTTSRIFVVVILFGAGTDYCLFLIARLREEAALAPWPVACRNALSGVTGALLGSAMTTVVGLGMLWFAEFGKFHYTGPIIAICLLVGLAVCTTLTPALLRALGPAVYWPSKVPNYRDRSLTFLGSGETTSLGSGAWSWIALALTRRPVISLVFGLCLVSIPAVYGFLNERTVTYDLSSQLDKNSASRRGQKLLVQNFEIGELNPITVLLTRPEDTDRDQLEHDIRELTATLYDVPGVAAVRTVDDPLGDFPPDREMGLLSSDGWKRWTMRNHRITQGYFFSENPDLRDRLVRLDVIIHGDPFLVETAGRVTVLENRLTKLMADETSSWSGTSVGFAGTTPSIIDLRSVTLSDNVRIKIAVVVAVFAVLLLVIRKVGLCVYLIVTVLISYFATLGLTVLFFQYAYGDDFVGLDWKLPLFLFVILVAVGQDYNVYLVTRIVEEQKRLGWLSALRRAVSRTGGIITACGLVMAATFFSMTASAWFPPLARFVGLSVTLDAGGLRGIVELGFALGLGVMIDTFYVRTILVPSFVAALGRLSSNSDA